MSILGVQQLRLQVQKLFPYLRPLETDVITDILAMRTSYMIILLCPDICSLWD